MCCLSILLLFLRFLWGSFCRVSCNRCKMNQNDANCIRWQWSADGSIQNRNVQDEIGWNMMKYDDICKIMMQWCNMLKYDEIWWNMKKWRHLSHKEVACNLAMKYIPFVTALSCVAFSLTSLQRQNKEFTGKTCSSSWLLWLWIKT